MAEFLGGTEEAFVQKMNDRAKELGMNDTTFKNSHGIDEEGHLTSAYDIAIMSRELSKNHSSIHNYTTIWMDTITHHTARGDSEFGLANTNKFLKKYEGANGLKTGYTSVAGFSMSATAVRNGTTLIAVVMGSTTKDIRYKDAAALLDYGFNNCIPYSDEKVLSGDISDGKVLESGNRIIINDGIKSSIAVEAEKAFRTVLLGNSNEGEITKRLELIKSEAPIQKNDIIAKMIYEQNGNEIGSVNIIASETVDKKKYKNVFDKILRDFINID